MKPGAGEVAEALSYGQRESLVAARLRELFTVADEEDRWRYGPWIRDLFDAEVVFEWKGVLWRNDYAIDDNGTLTMGEPVRVEVNYVEITQPPEVTRAEESVLEPLSEVGDPLPSDLELDDTGSTLIRIMSPGWGSSGYYSAETLRRDGPRVFTAGKHMYWDHPGENEKRDRPERSLRDLAGVLTSTAMFRESGPAGPGLYATAKVFKGYRDGLSELAPHIGISWRGYGKPVVGMAEGRSGRIITELVAASSVDYVTQPGRGGAIVAMFEAARPQEETMTEPTTTTTTTTPVTTPVVEASESERVALAENAVLKEQIMLGDAARIAGELVTASESLHAVTRARLMDTLPKVAKASADGKLDEPAFRLACTEAIAAEVEYLAKITGQGKPKGVGQAVETSESEDPAKVAAIREGLAKTLQSWGLSESAAKVAAER